MNAPGHNERMFIEIVQPDVPPVPFHLSDKQAKKLVDSGQNGPGSIAEYLCLSSLKSGACLWRRVIVSERRLTEINRMQSSFVHKEMTARQVAFQTPDFRCAFA